MTSPLSYFLHYFMRLRPSDASSALVFGASIDTGINSLLCDMRDGREPSLERAKVLFDTEFGAFEPSTIKYSKADSDESVLTEDDKNWLAKNDVPRANQCLKRKGYMILEAYVEQVLPKIEKVLLVQHEVALTNELGDSLIGIVDLVAQIGGQTYILDNKTSSIKYAEDSASISHQLGTYFEALKDEYKLDGVGYIVIPKNLRKKKEPRVPIEMKFGQVSEDILNETFEMYETALDGIKNGRFECGRNQKNGCCSNPWPCSYRRYCESNGTDLTGLKYVDKSR